jgi:hypothetical protein
MFEPQSMRLETGKGCGRSEDESISRKGGLLVRLFRTAAPGSGKRIGTLYFLGKGFSLQVFVCQSLNLVKHSAVQGFGNEDFEHDVSGHGFNGCQSVNLFKELRRYLDTDLFFTHRIIIGNSEKK